MRLKLKSRTPQNVSLHLAKLLDVTPQQVAERHLDFINAVDALVGELETRLTAEERQFLERLPQIAQELDVHSTEASAVDDVELMLEWLQDDLPKNSVLIFTVRGAVNERNRLVRAIDAVGRYRPFAPVEAGPSVNRDLFIYKSNGKTL